MEGSGALIAISAGAAGLARGNVGVVRLLRHCGDAGDVIVGEMECRVACRARSESAGRRERVVVVKCGCGSAKTNEVIEVVTRERERETRVGRADRSSNRRDHDVAVRSNDDKTKAKTRRTIEQSRCLVPRL